MTMAAGPPAPAPAPAPVSVPAAGSATGRAGPGGQRPVSPTARDLWRRWRVPLALAAVILLGAIAIAFLIFLALLGSKDALGLIVVLAAGITMIAVGGAMRGQMRSH
jgi:hypothetical protein